MIRVKELSKTFGDYRAVDRVSFELSKGEVLGFLGPNGAGKSTTMKMLTCFIPPTSGTAEICGHDILKDSVAVRQQIGYLPESAPSYQEMRVEEFLAFVGAVRGFMGHELQQKIERALELAALKEVRYQMIETLSKGYRQRTCLAQALLHEPPVLILDEPTDGLDPNQKHEVRTLIKRLSSQCAILVSTHILEEVEAVCSRAIIIAKGKIVADGTPEELLARSSYHNAVSLSLKVENPESFLNDLKQIQGVSAASLIAVNAQGSASFQLFPQAQQTILGEVEKFIQGQRLSVEQMYVERGRLDEVFRKVTLTT